MKGQFELSPEEERLMMNDFQLSITYDHETFGKLISGNTHIRQLLQSANIEYRALKHLDELFERSLSEEEKEYFKVVMAFELAMKTMHSIECLASLLAAYRKRNPRFHEEITRYSLDNDAIEILKKSREGTLQLSDIRDLFGFPSDGGIRKKMIGESCRKIQAYLKELTDFYFPFKELYRRYKHGHPFGVIKWLREKAGKVVGYMPLLIYLDQDKVEKNRKRSGKIWRFGVNWGGLLSQDSEELFHKIRIVYNLYFIAKYNCHMRTFYPELGLARALVKEPKASEPED